MGVREHKERAKGVGAIRVALITTSDSITIATDETGRAVKKRLAEAGHKVVWHGIVRNKVKRIRRAVEEALAGDAQAVITTGGTGVGRRDVTIEAVSPLLEKVLPGFGELYRRLSYDEIGPAAMLSRALLGVAKGKVVACIPGSTGGVKVALEDLLLPELAHVLSVAGG